MTDDSDLLRKFVDESSDQAFRQLVAQRIDFVYAAALRQVGGDAHLASEVAQNVFLDLARKAKKLKHRTTLTGWFFTSTRFAAYKALRTRSRRLKHETEAQAMNEILSPNSIAPESEWNELRPVLDDAMHDLSPTDRDAILLRFFDGCSLAEVGHALGLAENSARMRVDRALEKLQSHLARRGITSTAVALGGVLIAQPIVAAPAGLAATVATSALGSVAAVASGISFAGVLGAVGAATAIIVGVTTVSHLPEPSPIPPPSEQIAASIPPVALEVPQSALEIPIATEPEPRTIAPIPAPSAHVGQAKLQPSTTATASSASKFVSSNVVNIEAAYLLNFLRYVEWPAQTFDAERRPRVIGVVQGNPPSSIIPALELIVKGRLIGGRSVEIIAVWTIADANRCHILFIPQSEKLTESEWYNAVNGLPILTVGDSDLALSHGAAIGLVLSNNRLRYRLSPSKIAANHLSARTGLTANSLPLITSRSP